MQIKKLSAQVGIVVCGERTFYGCVQRTFNKGMLTISDLGKQLKSTSREKRCVTEICKRKWIGTILNRLYFLIICPGHGINSVFSLTCIFIIIFVSHFRG